MTHFTWQSEVRLYAFPSWLHGEKSFWKFWICSDQYVWLQKVKYVARHQEPGKNTREKKNWGESTKQLPFIPKFITPQQVLSQLAAILHWTLRTGLSDGLSLQQGLPWENLCKPMKTIVPSWSENQAKSGQLKRSSFSGSWIKVGLKEQKRGPC